jgi:transcriptional regulator with XRE-family HTH domain
MVKEPNATDRHVGQRVRQRRQELGLSQTALGDSVGLTFQQIQKYEKGTNRISSSRLQQFANILKVGVPYFFEGAPGQRKISIKAPSTDYIAAFTAMPEAQRLMQAYMRIESPILRRQIAKLVLMLAE